VTSSSGKPIRHRLSIGAAIFAAGALALVIALANPWDAWAGKRRCKQQPERCQSSNQTRDTSPPETTIKSAPGESETSDAAEFAFESSERKSRFRCRLDGVAWQACNSPKSYDGLAAGEHTLEVQAVDKAGNADPSPASHTWTVAGQPLPIPDTTPPDTQIAVGPTGTVDSDTAELSFTSTEQPSTFRCRLDGAPWEECISPKSYEGLADGLHTFEVKALDEAGNADLTPAVQVWTAVTEPVEGSALFSDDFSGPDGILTNHYAFWHGGTDAFRDANWEMESGSAYRHDETAWTGTPTDNFPNIDSSNGSGSQIFRLWTKDSSFENVTVEMDLRNNGYSSGSASVPAESWDGVKIWLRRQGASGSVALYTAEVNRRQGNVIIQKKCAGSSSYTILGNSPWSGSPHPAKIGHWEHVGGSIRTNADGSVTIQVIRSGGVVLTATDRGAGSCAPITSPGKVGVRGDNTDFNFDNFTVTES
jgi:hypothetical protein